MSKLLSMIVAAVFAVSTGSVLAASHAGAKMDDKKMEKKDEKKDGMKKDEKKDGMKKDEKKDAKK